MEEEEILVLVGPSGCGKTTLLRVMAGILPPTTGSAYDDGIEIAAPSWRRGIVFQNPHLYPWLTVSGNVEFGLRMRRVPKSTRNREVERFLRLVHLWDYRDAYPYELSGGMQQRTAIARVLANGPHILLLDEPFGALDAMTRERMQDELLSIWRETKKTIVLVTHSVEEAVYLGSRVVTLSNRPARIVADIPCRIDHTAGPRTSPEFAVFRERVRGSIEMPDETGPNRGRP